MEFNKAKTFSEEDLSAICKRVRSTSPSLDTETLLRLLWIHLQKEMGFAHANTSLTDLWETKAQGYKHHINLLLDPRKHPPFDHEGVIIRDLFDEKES